MSKQTTTTRFAFTDDFVKKMTSCQKSFDECAIAHVALLHKGDEGSSDIYGTCSHGKRCKFLIRFGNVSMNLAFDHTVKYHPEASQGISPNAVAPPKPEVIAPAMPPAPQIVGFTPVGYPPYPFAPMNGYPPQFMYGDPAIHMLNHQMAMGVYPAAPVTSPLVAMGAQAPAPVTSPLVAMGAQAPAPVTSPLVAQPVVEQSMAPPSAPSEAKDTPQDRKRHGAKEQKPAKESTAPRSNPKSVPTKGDRAPPAKSKPGPKKPSKKPAISLEGCKHMLLLEHPYRVGTQLFNIAMCGIADVDGSGFCKRHRDGASIPKSADESVPFDDEDQVETPACEESRNVDNWYDD